MKGEGEATYLPPGQQLSVPPVLFYRPERVLPGVVARRGRGQSQLNCLLQSPEGGFWPGLLSLSLGRLKAFLTDLVLQLPILGQQEKFHLTSW